MVPSPPVGVWFSRSLMLDVLPLVLQEWPTVLKNKEEIGYSKTAKTVGYKRSISIVLVLSSG